MFADANKTTYKSTYQLLKDISEIYDDLTDKQQAGLLEALAGKRQGQIVAATIKNFSAAEEALNNMANSAGSAEAELETYQESAEYLFNQFKETFTSIAQNAIKKDDLKNLIKFGTSMLEIVDKIVSQIGLIPTILSTAVGIVAAKKNVNNNLLGFNVNNGKLGMNFLGAQVGSGWKQQRAEIKAFALETKTALNDLWNGMKNNEQETEKFKAAYATAIKNNSAEVRAFAQSAKEGTATVQQMGAAMNNASGVGTKLKSVIAGIGNAALSMGITMLVSSALSAIFKGFKDATQVVENYVNKISELKDKEKSLKSEMESLNTELSGVKTRIYELEKLPKLTLLEQDELNRLKESNDELERQIRLKRGELAKTASERNKEAQKLWETMQYGDGKTIKDWGFWDYATLGLKPAAENMVSSISTLANHNLFSQQMKDLEEYKKIIETVNELKKSDAYKNGEKDATGLVNAMQEVLGKLHDEIQKHYSEEWISLSTGLDPTLNENKEILKQVNSVINEWDKLNGKVDKTFEEVYNNSKFVTVKNALEQLALAGELTSDKFEKFTDKDIEGIEEFKKSLEEIGVTDFEEVCEAIIKFAKDSASKLDKAAGSVENFAEALEKLYDTIDDVLSKQEKLLDAFKKIQFGASLSAQEIYKLVRDMPRLEEYVKPTEGGYTISAEGFSAMSKENQKQVKETVEQNIKSIREQISLLEKRDELEKIRDNAAKQMESSNGLVADFKRWEYAESAYRKASEACVKITESLDDLKESLKDYEFLKGLVPNLFDEHKAALEVIGEAYDSAKSKVSDFNKEIQTIDNAIKKLNEGNLLNYEELNDIVDFAPELEDFFENQENGYTISIDKLEELRKKSYQTRNDYIDDVRARVKAEKQALEESAAAIKDKIEKTKSSISSTSDYIFFQGLNKELRETNKLLNAVDDVLEKLDGLERDLTYDAGKDNDITNKLQNEIDYYKTILSAIEAVQDKYTEAIDNEIDALQESKDALKENNDERQREIDLIEARNNLENAKKRKVMVYSEGSGFKQVADQKAIKEAEEKYRDAITDIQEAEIDKQIDLLEKQKEAFEKQNKDLTELEDNIEKAKIINQAMQALGITDEKDLLNLSDDVKEGIIKGLTEATLNKEQEENKDNKNYTPADLNDVLKSLGATVTAEELKAMKNELPTEAVYNAAVKGFSDSLKEFADKAVQNVTNNNNGMVVSPTFNIYDASDPNKVAKVVDDKITDLLTRYNNSIK